MRLVSFLSLFLLVLSVSNPAFGKGNKVPNIILIVSDDQGWNDVGFNGCKEIPTPNLDKLAASGTVFTSGYAPHPYCSPSRAGILTGKNQQSFGHENNPGFDAAEGAAPDGLPLDQTLLSQVLRRKGYVTAAIGKWHLGDEPRYWPINRGFDYWYGFSGGGMSYWGEVNKNKGAFGGVLENGKPVPLDELSHLTDDFSSKAVDFVKKNEAKPFFLYLAYNAPHAPDHATKAHLALTGHIEYGGRSVYGAMVAGMDAGIGKVLNQLEVSGLWHNTLIVFLSDNGGRAEHANNFPYRGHKGMLFEGGIRVPFLMTWPGKIKAGTVTDNPVSGIDIMPTLLSAAGAGEESEIDFDGIDLMPYVTNLETWPQSRTLYWRYSGGKGWAVRKGDFKLIYSHYKSNSLLFDLKHDPYEQNDISGNNPDVVEELHALYLSWDKNMMKPLWGDPHIENVEREEQALRDARSKASSGEK